MLYWIVFRSLFPHVDQKCLVFMPLDDEKEIEYVSIANKTMNEICNFNQKLSTRLSFCVD